MLRQDSHASFWNTSSLLALAFALCAAGGANAGTLPGHGHYVAGHGRMSKAGQVLTIDQSSRTGIINWKTFSIGKKNSVEFNNAGGATLNWVTGGNMSRIAGALHGAGSVYLINNAGVAVLPTGKVVTQGSFAASGRNADNDAFLGGKKRLLFTGGANGDVVNAGSITSVNGRVDLIGRNVTQSGLLTARNASLVARGTMTVSGRIGAARDVETSGRRVRFAGAAIAARDWLIDPVNLTITSSAAKSIDKSLNKGTNVTLQTTATGASGPGRQTSGLGDIIVAASLTWSSNAALTLEAYHDVQVNSGVTIRNTNAGNLTLAADGRARDSGTVSFDGVVDFSKSTGDVLIYYHPASYKKPVSFKSNVSVKSGSHFAAFMTIDNADDLQAMASNLNGEYALNANINAGSIANFKPVGSNSSDTNATRFNGILDGRGHKISNLKIKSGAAAVGLFGGLGTKAQIKNLGLVNVSVTGTAGGLVVGALAGKNEGKITNVYSTGFLVGRGDAIGGLVGDNGGTGVISLSHSAATVTDHDTTSSFAQMGGLVGINYHTISGSYATGNVTESENQIVWLGGLVGWSESGTISGSHATGGVNGSGDFSYAGGLIGELGNSGSFPATSGVVTGSYATGTVEDNGFTASVGGLIGTVSTSGSSVTASHASGAVTGGGQYAFVGGLIGSNGGTVSSDQASGNVTGGNDSYDGSLIGSNSGSVSGSTASGSVSGGTNSCVGGLIGYPGGAGAGCL